MVTESAVDSATVAFIILIVAFFTFIGSLIFSARDEYKNAIQHSLEANVCAGHGNLKKLDTVRGFPQPIVTCEDGILVSGKW